VRFDGKALQQLAGESSTEPASGGISGKGAVIISTALSQPMTKGGESETGADDDVEVRSWLTFRRFVNSKGSFGEDFEIGDSQKFHRAFSGHARKEPGNPGVSDNEIEKLGLGPGPRKEGNLARGGEGELIANGL